MQKIKTGDEVVILAGNDKGRRGRVLRFKGSHRVVVEGVKMVKKCVRANPQKNEQGGIIEKEAAIHISNIALYNSATDKPSRVGVKTLEDGQKVRYFKDNGEVFQA